MTCTSIQYQSMMKIVYPAYYGLPVTFVYWKSKNKNKIYIYINCCELTVYTTDGSKKHSVDLYTQIDRVNKLSPCIQVFLSQFPEGHTRFHILR